MRDDFTFRKVGGKVLPDGGKGFRRTEGTLAMWKK